MAYSTAHDVGSETQLVFVGNGAFRGATAQNTIGTITVVVHLTRGRGARELDLVFVGIGKLEESTASILTTSTTSRGAPYGS